MATPAGILLTELRHVVDDLAPLIGQPVVDAWVPSPHAVILGIGGGGMLYLETWPWPRLHPVRTRPRNPAKPFSFQGLLRRRFAGPIDAIHLVGDDRVVEIAIGSLVLHARLLGRGGGLWLCDGDRVLAASDGPAPAALPPMPDGAPSTSPPRFAPAAAEGWAEAAARWLSDAAREARDEALRTHVRRALGARIKRQTRLVDGLAADLVRAGRADTVRREADALAMALHTIPRGASSAQLPDVDDPAVLLDIALDPARSAADAMNQRYATARRLDTACADIAARHAAAEATRERLVADRARVDTAPPALLRDLIRAHNLPAADTARGPSAPRAVPWQTWVGPGDARVLVGRNATANHALTVRHARGRDWWMHLRGRPGAHAILPTAERDGSPPLDHLLAAARLLLRDARIGEGESHDVQYARVSDVRPIKGGPPGAVTVTHERVLHVAREPGDLDAWKRSD